MLRRPAVPLMVVAPWAVPRLAAAHRSGNRDAMQDTPVDHEAVYLPLDEGDNELLLAVNEASGGWGMIARLEDRGGIELRTESPEGTAPIRRFAATARPGGAGGW